MAVGMAVTSALHRSFHVPRRNMVDAVTQCTKHFEFDARKSDDSVPEPVSDNECILQESAFHRFLEPARATEPSSIDFPPAPEHHVVATLADVSHAQDNLVNSIFEFDPSEPCLYCTPWFQRSRQPCALGL